MNADNDEDRGEAIRALSKQNLTQAERELVDTYRMNPVMTAIKRMARNPVFLKYRKQ